MALSLPQKQAIAAASRQAVSAGARRALTQILRRRWLAPRNRYRVATITSIESDHASGTINSRHLTEYGAVSAPLHCLDGWAYLGRAMGCHLHGDSDSARHLAYYAELRAAMSLLASQGVLVLNQQHFIVDSRGSVSHLKRGGTHEVAWDALEEWAGLRQTSSFLGDILRPADKSLNDWIKAMPNGASWQPIATDWLRKLGLDLQLLSSDRRSRNEASYRPSRLNQRASLTSETAATAVREIWSLLEPAPPLSFGELDRYLLRLTIETAFKATEGNSPAASKRKFGSVVESVVSSNVTGANVALWEQFLKRQLDPDDPGIIDLVRLKQRPRAPSNAERDMRRPDHHLSVMARALLLLRVASGATRQMLVDAGINLDHLEFWWQRFL